jgi:hypothetical protein
MSSSVSAPAWSDPRAFLAELAKIERGTAGSPRLVASHGSTACDNCSRCMFCEGCTACHACNYAVDCLDCTRLTHALRCDRCHNGTHLTDCLRCHDSAYLVRCTDCVSCTYCLGCVGLVGKEFHILNQPVDRKTYFKVLKALGQDLTPAARGR